MAAATTPAGTSVSTSQATPTWYDQLSKSFADTLAGGVNNVGGLNANWYSDPLVQGLDPLQQNAITAAGTFGGTWQPGLNAAGTTTANAVTQAQDASTFDPTKTTQFMNPYLQGAQTATINASNKNLFQDVMPKINSTFAGTGQFGSTRNADFMNKAIDNQQRTLTDSIGNLNYGAQTEAFKNQLGWGQLGTQGAQVMGGLGNYQMNQGNATAENTWNDLLKQLGIGGIDQAQGQKELDASYNDWQKQLTLPMELMKTMSSILPNMTQLYNGNTTQVSMPNTAQSGGLEQILAAILAGKYSGSTA